MLPLKAIAMPHLLKLIFYLITFNRPVYREIELIALMLMTSSKTCKHELVVIQVMSDIHHWPELIGHHEIKVSSRSRKSEFRNFQHSALKHL